VRARTVGDLRRELDGVHDDVPLHLVIDDRDADVERVDTSAPSHVELHAGPPADGGDW
jgi:hypothetical protein